ncbi:MAG: hypothetical protein ACE5G5_06525 [Candidatus Methylomirabilales bacterium]
MKSFLLGCAIVTLLNAVTIPATAGEADVLSVIITKTGVRTYTLHVAVRHDDEGWEHYADRWEVVAPDGKVLAKRTLYHPHVEEQPFTRSLNSLVIPEGITRVRVRAHDKVHGLGGVEQEVVVPE